MNYNTPNLLGLAGNPAGVWSIYSAVRWISRRLNKRKIADAMAPAKIDTVLGVISFDRIASLKAEMIQTSQPVPSTPEQEPPSIR